MRKKVNVINNMSIASLVFISIIFIVTFEACKKSDSIDTPIVNTTGDLTHLPFGDSKILRRDMGQLQPAMGSLWLCGVPPNGAGNSNASDWKNADGTWDFTRKPTVDGNVMWPSVFNARLDGLGNRIITGNGLPI